MFQNEDCNFASAGKQQDVDQDAGCRPGIKIFQTCSAGSLIYLQYYKVEKVVKAKNMKEITGCNDGGDLNEAGVRDGHADHRGTSPIKVKII